MLKRKVFFSIMAAFMILSVYSCNGSNRQIETPAATLESGTQTETPAPEPKTPAEASASVSDVLPESDSNTTPLETSADETSKPDVPVIPSGEVLISLEYARQSGSASNQYAIWVEDLDGNFIQTIFATRWTVNGGYKTRPDSIALWAEKSGLADMPKSEVDAISGATPKAGRQTYTWDLTSSSGDTVPSGEYRFFIEGTLRWKNYVLYSCIIEIGDKPVTVQADADYVYEGSDRYAALTSESPENNMISAVTISFIPYN